MTSCSMGLLTFPDVEKLKRRPQEVPRLIILDGANVVMGTSPSISNIQKKITTSGLLSLMRAFTVEGFEVVVIMQDKYLKKDVISFGYNSLEALLKENLLLTVPKHTFDDLMLFELAKKTNGLVVSNDSFSDHQASSEKYSNLVEKNYGNLQYIPATIGRNEYTADGHFLANFSFIFPEHDKLFSTPLSPSHELSEERITSFTDEKREQICNLLNTLIEVVKQEEKQALGSSS